jgi:hypothetical protein
VPYPSPGLDLPDQLRPQHRVAQFTDPKQNLDVAVPADSVIQNTVGNKRQLACPLSDGV